MISRYPKCLALILMVGLSSGVASSVTQAQESKSKLSKANTHRAQDLINQLKILALDMDSMMISEFTTSEAKQSYLDTLNQADQIIAELQFYDEDPSVNLKGFSPNKHLAVIAQRRSFIESIAPLKVVPTMAELSQQIFQEIEDLDKHRQLINYYHKKLNSKVKAASNPALASRLQPYFFTAMLNEANDALNFLVDIEASQARLVALGKEFKKFDETKVVLLSRALAKNAAMIETNKAIFILAKEIAEEALENK